MDSEIYVDRIVDMRINDVNAMLEVARKKALEKAGGEDVYTRSLEVGQIDETEYFAHIIYDNLKVILKDIREEHKPDTTTAAPVFAGSRHDNGTHERCKHGARRMYNACQ